jgi:hypothetical protein
MPVLVCAENYFPDFVIVILHIMDQLVNLIADKDIIRIVSMELAK